MDWFLETPERLSLFVGGVGLVGTLVGAGIGFASSFAATTRQLDRQQRDYRRMLYGNFLAKANALTTGELRSVLHEKSRENHLAYLKEFDMGTEKGNADFGIVSGVVSDDTKRLRDKGEDLIEEKLGVASEMAADSRRLQIAAPDSIRRTGKVIANMLLSAKKEVRTSKELVAALGLFETLARADTKGVGAEPWRCAVRKAKPELERLEEFVEAQKAQEKAGDDG